MYRLLTSLLLSLLWIGSSHAQNTLLLQQADLGEKHIAFIYGGDVWVSSTEGGQAKRITSTAAIERAPHISPDGKHIAFSSNRTGSYCVYSVSIKGGEPQRLTFHPSSAYVRGWTNDGANIFYVSDRDSAPSRINRLYQVSKTGGPETKMFEQWATDAAYSPDGKKMVIDRIRRWDTEWRVYRGGQNTPLSILDIKSLKETLLPNEQTTDIQPVWMGDQIYFLSDRDATMNVWVYGVKDQSLKQVTTYEGSDIKSLSGNGSTLLFERDGQLHLLNPSNGKTTALEIQVIGDFPWAEKKWEDVSRRASAVSLSATGQRAILEARGEIFTVPVEFGNSRNITNSSGAADRRPIWSPDGSQIAWFTDEGHQQYRLRITNQDGQGSSKDISIGQSKLGWEPVWSPDGKHIAFNDDDVRIKVLTVENESIQTIDVGGSNIERGDLGLTWSPDSKWLAYSKSSDTGFKRIYLWSMEQNKTMPVTNEMAHSIAPSWDASGQYIYFLASTDLALSSGWANTSSMGSRPSFTPYLINLRKSDPSPFEPRSDEEESKKEDKEEKEAKSDSVYVDLEGIAMRTIALPMSSGKSYGWTMTGPKGSVFIAERVPEKPGWTIHKFNLSKRKATEFTSGVSQFSTSANGKKAIARVGSNWKVFDTGGDKGKGESLKVSLKMHLDPKEEWRQVFEEAWRYQQDYFYDPNMHGRDWNRVYDRYSALIPYVRHRADLTYILDMMNGELSVGHSFVGGGDFPDTESYPTGLLGADLIQDKGLWKVQRIFTTESWNPELSSPLSRPGIEVQEGDYIHSINGQNLTAEDNIFEALAGTNGVQTSITFSRDTKAEESFTETIIPIRSESSLRQRAWVEDNRRRVDELSDGQLAYVWVPNTGGSGYSSFNRYLFAQQNKRGLIVDERFNGGGLLDDYMVDLLTRELRAAITNEVPGGKPFSLPAGIHGPKVLLINEMAGSGGDYFPWVFRHQAAGTLIGQTTWGGLVKSSRHYAFIDGSGMTAPDNAVFDPIEKEWIGENVGIAPDIAVRQDAKSVEAGGDPQLEKAVQVLLEQLKSIPVQDMSPPPYSTPAKLD